jgi:hypothetical protein
MLEPTARLPKRPSDDDKYPKRDALVPAHQCDVTDIHPSFYEVEDIIHVRKHVHKMMILD